MRYIPGKRSIISYSLMMKTGDINEWEKLSHGRLKLQMGLNGHGTRKN
jgi:hypothetical protein